MIQAAQPRSAFFILGVVLKKAASGVLAVWAGEKADLFEHSLILITVLNMADPKKTPLHLFLLRVPDFIRSNERISL